MSKICYKRTLLIAIISTLSVSSFCQSPNQAGVNLGCGIWDGFHAGASYRLDRYSTGLDLGWMEGFHPLWNGRNLMVVLNNNYYFRKKNELSNKETLIFLNSTYLNYEDLHMINQIILINAGLGREISLGRSFSLGYQAGPILPVYAKRKRKTDIEDMWAAVPVLVNLRLRVTYKIGKD